VLREGQAQIEALPRADLVLEGNYGGRDTDTWRWGGALNDSGRNTDRPGGLIGLRIEVPLMGDDLRARLDRRRLETRQIESQGRATLATIVAEAEITLNEYNVAWRELAARAGALRATSRDLQIETERWNQGVAGGRGEAAANALERLLAAQERVVEAEERFATSQATFTLAFLALQRVQGTFTSLQQLEMQRIDDAARGPSFVFRRDAQAGSRPAAPAPTGATR
jgi:outer membrane protein TolC